MRDRITTKDALVFTTLLQQDVAGIYWMIWEVMSGAFLLDWMRGSSHNAAVDAPASEARGDRVPLGDNNVITAPPAGMEGLLRQSELLDAA